jgi:hypothetical protein
MTIPNRVQLILSQRWLFLARGCDLGHRRTHRLAASQNYAPAQRTDACATATFDVTKPYSWKARDGGSFNTQGLRICIGMSTRPRVCRPKAHSIRRASLVGQGRCFGSLVPRSLVFDQATGHSIRG